MCGVQDFYILFYLFIFGWWGLGKEAGVSVASIILKVERLDIEAL